MFTEQREYAVLKASSSMNEKLAEQWSRHGSVSSLESAMEIGLRLWGLASLLQTTALIPGEKEDSKQASSTGPADMPEESALTSRIRETLSQETLECVLLDREVGAMELYRALEATELQSLLPRTYQLST